MASPATPSDDGTLQWDTAAFARERLSYDNDAAAALLPSPTSQHDSRGRLSRYCHRASDGLYAQALHLAEWLESVQGRGVLKCTIAYTIASLATFVGPLSDFLGRPDGKHVVATITVYFHAARSAGSMIEAILIAIMAVAYAEAISILSMITSVLVGSKLGLVTLAHILVVVIFIGGGFGFMGWVKQKMNNPLVNVGSTLASIAIIAVVTKEDAVVSGVFSNQKIAQVLKMLVMGISSAAAVNLLVWPASARTQLRGSMLRVSTALGQVLTATSVSFLRGDGQHEVFDDISRAFSSYKQTHTVLLRNLREAKFEHYLIGCEKIYVVERSIVKAIETLAQSIGGLKSAAKTQQTLLNASTANPTCGASDLYMTFTDMMRPSMQEFAEILAQVLLEPVFGGPPNYEVRINVGFRQILSEKLSVFVSCRIEALQHVYELASERTVDNNANTTTLEEMAAACGHFSFSLQAFGEEMKKYLDLLEDLKDVAKDSKRSWQWLLWWRSDSARGYSLSARPFEPPQMDVDLIKPIKKSSTPRGIPESMRQRRDMYSWQAAANERKIMAKLSQTMLRLLRRMARDDVLFGIKVGIGAALWAMLAFVDITRPLYHHYRGEWGLLSFMIVCSMTVGASNTTGWSRFIGTFLGAAFSVINWKLSQGNAVALVIFGWLVSFFNFFLIVAKGQAPLGRMTILAYNVSTLYAYSLSQKVDDDDDDEGGSRPLIMQIVKHRVISVTTGILWGLIVCRLIWPISARRKFKEGMSVLLLQMGLIWRRGPLAILLRTDCAQNYLKSGEQAALQRYADRLESLRNSAASEFELRGPFPFHANGRLLQSANKMLDSFCAMSLVTQTRHTLTAGEKALLESTADERLILCDRICHIFQVLASSIMLEYPLTDAIPSIHALRDRLLSKISMFRTISLTGPRAQHTPAVTERDFALLYAYVLVTGQVADELHVAAAEIEALLGVLDGESSLLE